VSAGVENRREGAKGRGGRESVVIAEWDRSGRGQVARVREEPEANVGRNVGSLVNIEAHRVRDDGAVRGVHDGGGC